MLFQPPLQWHGHSTINDGVTTYPHQPINQLLQATIQSLKLGLSAIDHCHSSAYAGYAALGHSDSNSESTPTRIIIL